jgi:hypothetical protein
MGLVSKRSRMWPRLPRCAIRRNVGARLRTTRDSATGREWRRGPESNRPTRICNPVHNRFATAPCPASRATVSREPTGRKREASASLCFCPGAGDESRTRDLNLGKVALYQLSYSRVARRRRSASTTRAQVYRHRAAHAPCERAARTSSTLSGSGCRLRAASSSQSLPPPPAWRPLRRRRAVAAPSRGRSRAPDRSTSPERSRAGS